MKGSKSHKKHSVENFTCFVFVKFLWNWYWALKLIRSELKVFELNGISRESRYRIPTKPYTPSPPPTPNYGLYQKTVSYHCPVQYWFPIIYHLYLHLVGVFKCCDFNREFILTLYHLRFFKIMSLYQNHLYSNNFCKKFRRRI